MRLLVLMAVLFSSGAFALDDYKCLIKNVVTVNNNGDLKEIGDKSVINKLFTVNRRTGDMTGPIKNNYLTTPTVLDYGSYENSFKAVTTMKNEITTNIYVLTIEEFNDSPQKPFVFLSNADVFYGTCEHF
ncbi:hypothetical protein [Plesiomonas shigelloides]|uniref:hypothetical protein n=1 Tax=Plesiomonas shigelloides TaxID=703 RepID=UPI001C49B8F2|nr:hypothetical protein [Plesiomonas shigelloides]